MTAISESAAVEQRDALAQRLFDSALGGIELLTVQLGVQAGLYEALRDGEPATARQLAQRAGIAERYAREWLEQQASAGILHVAVPDEAAERVYALPAGHAEALLDPDSPGYVAAAGSVLVGLTKPLDEVVAAYRTGAGVGFARYGAELRQGIAGFNRPMFAGDLAAEWLPALGEVHQRLASGAAGRVLDVACGTGWSSIALARAYPKARIDGIDLDETSITEAREHAVEAGVADRVSFALGDAAAMAVDGGRGNYDLACLFEGLHDMGDPVGALRQVRGLLADGAPLLIADERVADTFNPPGDEVERLNYAVSVLHCLPATLAESPKIAHGTVLRAGTIREWAHEAGFGGVEELPIANDLWRFYRLDP